MRGTMTGRSGRIDHTSEGHVSGPESGAINARPGPRHLALTNTSKHWEHQDD